MLMEKEGNLIQNDEIKFIVANAYFPNDHNQGVTFAEKMYTKVLEVQAEYPDHVTIFCWGYERLFIYKGFN
jgi:hypothetical protein